jgi:serine O-acetyltransferase
MNDPVVKAIHSLLDHVVNIDGRLQELESKLADLGVRLPPEIEKDGFDANYLNRIVD